jgi:hypothetical protein
MATDPRNLTDDEVRRLFAAHLRRLGEQCIRLARLSPADHLRDESVIRIVQDHTWGYPTSRSSFPSSQRSAGSSPSRSARARSAALLVVSRCTRTLPSALRPMLNENGSNSPAAMGSAS